MKKSHQSQPIYILCLVFFLCSATSITAQEVGKHNKLQYIPICSCSVCLFVSFVASLFTSGYTHIGIAEDEREFDYLQGSGKGPKQWGAMKKEWSACKNGGMQSPIDLSSHRVTLVPNLGKLNISYNPCNATVKNRGHDISIYWEGNAGSIHINGTQYLLKQSHWHSPSEHSVNGRRYDMELHMVHLSSDPNVTNKIAVVGVLYKIGRPDSFLSKVHTYSIDQKTNSRLLKFQYTWIHMLPDCKCW